MRGLHLPYELSAAARAQLRVMKLIAVALLAGATIFAVIAIGVAPTAPGLDLDPLRLVWAGLAVAELPALIAVRRALFRQAIAAASKHLSAPATGAAGADTAHHASLSAAYTRITIISFALLEGLALFACVVVLLGGEPVDLALVAFPVAMMLTVFPTAGRLERLHRAANEPPARV